METWDVTVAGAGVAGLATAEQLGNAGLKVLVLDARDLVGGRILTLPGLTPEHGIELGAEFVHGKPPEFDEYLRKPGLRLRETYGQSYCLNEGGLEPCEGLDSTILDRLNKMSPTDFPDEQKDQLEAEALKALSRILAISEDALHERFVRSYFHNWQEDTTCRPGSSAPEGFRVSFAGTPCSSQARRRKVTATAPRYTVPSQAASGRREKS